MAALAPGIVAQTLDDHARFIGNRRDRAEMVRVEACPREGGDSAYKRR
jgi:hypothetical protein